MPEYIGTIPVPEKAPFGTFPLVVRLPFATSISPDYAVHTFTAGNVKREQRFELGDGARRWRIAQQINRNEWRTLREFWETHGGSVYPFTFNAPQRDGTTIAYTVMFEDEPQAGEVSSAVGHVSVSITLREVSTGPGPTYPVNEINTRFPGAALAAGLAAQSQRIIPLVGIQPRLASYPTIRISDRRCTIGTVSYGARLLEPPTVRQSAAGVPGGTAETDEASINIGNADYVFSQLADAVNLDYAHLWVELYHIDTGVLLTLWSGEIARGGVTIDGPTCTIRASDPVSNPFVVIPPRRVDRSCTAPYNLAPLCPWAAVTGSTLDLVHFPSASATSCDHGYETPNGCLAHKMQLYYRGIPVSPQPFRSKDNSGGFFSRLFKNHTFTQLSQVSDSVIGQTLPMVFTNGVDLRMKALLVTGADQGDFYEGVGLIGIGPIGGLGNPIDQTIDGQPTHTMGKYPPRFSPGAEPSRPTDFISLSWNGDQRKGDFRKVYSGNSTYINNTAAGVAFCGIRRVDAKGEQFVALDDHEMEVTVRFGLNCYVFWGTAVGERALIVTTNPAWIALNVYFFGLQIRELSELQQHPYFDFTSVSTAAWICDWDVPSLIGSGTEIQFQYFGIISEERPLRDWLEDILRNCLGTFTIVGAKLRIDIRVNASAVAGFTEGNLIHQSVKRGPPGRLFNRFTVSFSDRVRDTINGETLFLPNTATAYDEDYALELGGGVIAQYFNGETNLSGTNITSQAQRIANVRLREEVGGVTPAERLGHKMIEGATTILGLDFCAGQVISVATRDIPGGTVKIRVSTWQMSPDYRISFQGVTVQDSMYDLVAGPKPADVSPGIIPPEQQPLAYRPMWFPNYIPPFAGDPIYPTGSNTFGLKQRYVPQADGSTMAMLEVTGLRPVNRALPDTLPPTYRSTGTYAGGALPMDSMYYMALTVKDANGRFSPACRVQPVYLAASVGNGIVYVADIEWPAGTWASWQLYMARDDERMMTLQVESSDFSQTALFMGGILYSLKGCPSPVPTRVLAMVKPAVHWGIWAMEINAMYGGGIAFDQLIGSTENYIGRKAAVITDRSDLEAPLWNFTVNGQDLATGRLYFDPDPIPLGVEVGDLATILLDPNIYTGITIGDAMVENVAWPTGLGDNPVKEKDKLIRGITPGRPHQIRRVVSHTRTTYTVDRPFDYKPLWYAVEEPSWPYECSSSNSIENDKDDSTLTLQIPVNNLAGLPVVVAGGIEDRFGTRTPEELLQIRYSYLYGSPAPAKFTIRSGGI